MQNVATPMSWTFSLREDGFNVKGWHKQRLIDPLRCILILCVVCMYIYIILHRNRPYQLSILVWQGNWPCFVWSTLARP